MLDTVIERFCGARDVGWLDLPADGIVGSITIYWRDRLVSVMSWSRTLASNEVL